MSIFSRDDRDWLSDPTKWGAAKIAALTSHGKPSEQTRAQQALFARAPLRAAGGDDGPLSASPSTIALT